MPLSYICYCVKSMDTKLQTTEVFGNPTIFWDYDFKTGTYTHAIRILLYEVKSTNNCPIIDVVISNDTNIANNVIEKIPNFSDLKVEISRSFGICELNIKVIPVVIGVLGSIPLTLSDFLDQLGIPYQGGGHTIIGSLCNRAYFGGQCFLSEVLVITWQIT